MTTFFHCTFAFAEDDGSAWEWVALEGGGAVPVQRRDLAIELVVESARAGSVGIDLVVDEPLAAELRAFCTAEVVAFRRVHVRGPQPEQRRLREMVQLDAKVSLRLAETSIAERRPNGAIRVRSPYVIRAGELDRLGVAPDVCRVHENDMVIVSERVMQRLSAAEPQCTFEAVSVEGAAP